MDVDFDNDFEEIAQTTVSGLPYGLLTDLRVVVVSDDAIFGATLVQTLRAAGASAEAARPDPDSLLRARRLDPQLVLVGPDCPENLEEELLQRDLRLRWASVARVTKPVETDTLLDVTNSAIENDRQLQAEILLAADKVFVPPFEALGPARIVRTLSSIPGARRVTARSSVAEASVTIHDGKILEASWMGVEPALGNERTGLEAVAGFLAMPQARATVEPLTSVATEAALGTVDDVLQGAALVQDGGDPYGRASSSPQSPEKTLRVATSEVERKLQEMMAPDVSVEDPGRISINTMAALDKAADAIVSSHEVPLPSDPWMDGIDVDVDLSFPEEAVSTPAIRTPMPPATVIQPLQKKKGSKLLWAAMIFTSLTAILGGGAVAAWYTVGPEQLASYLPEDVRVIDLTPGEELVPSTVAQPPATLPAVGSPPAATTPTSIEAADMVFEDDAAIEMTVETGTVENDSETRRERGRDLLSRAARAEPHEAIELYEQVLGRYPNNSRAVVGLAREHLAIGDAEGAARWADRAVELRPNHAPTWELLVRALRAKGDTVGAERASVRAATLGMPEQDEAQPELDVAPEAPIQQAEQVTAPVETIPEVARVEQAQETVVAPVEAAPAAGQLL